MAPTKKILFIIGPTATGKTSLALKLAQEFNGELISADSRQVYQGLDIITGKDIPKDFTYLPSPRLGEGRSPIKSGMGEVFSAGYYTNGLVNFHGLDLVKPGQDWNVSLFHEFTLKTIKKIHAHGKLPIIVGGTGLYIKSLLGQAFFPSPPNLKLRQKLESLPLIQLQQKLVKLNPSRFASMNHSDQHNPRRLIRAIEISSSPAKGRTNVVEVGFDSLLIGLTAPIDILEKRINQRVLDRLKQNPQKELEYLKSFNLPWTGPAATSLGYQELDQYYSGKITKPELISLWTTKERQYAKRQLTWFKKQPHIHWFDITQPDRTAVVSSTIKHWLKPPVA